MSDTIIAGPYRRLSDQVSVASGPPNLTLLDTLFAHEFRSVLDVREDRDKVGSLPPARLAESVAGRGMTYARLPLPTTQVDDAMLDRFGQVIKSLPKPVLVQCMSGKRSGMFALAHVAIEQGMPGEAMLESARGLGFLYGSKEMQQHFAHYVDRGEKRAEPLKQREQTLHHGAPETRAVAVRPAAGAAFVRAQPERDLMFATAALIFAGTLGGILFDRRLLLVPLLASGFMLQRVRTTWAYSGAAANDPAASVPPAVSDREIAELRGKLRSLGAAA